MLNGRVKLSGPPNFSIFSDITHWLKIPIFMLTIIITNISQRLTSHIKSDVLRFSFSKPIQISQKIRGLVLKFKKVAIQ